MRTAAEIPLSWPSAEGPLKRDLERQAAALDKFLNGLASTFAPRWQYLPIATGNTFAAFGFVRRIAPEVDQTIFVQLPRANVANAGRELRIQRMNREGNVYLVPPGSTINGDNRYHMLNSIGYLTVQWDGEDYYTEISGAAI